MAFLKAADRERSMMINANFSVQLKFDGLMVYTFWNYIPEALQRPFPFKHLPNKKW